MVQDSLRLGLAPELLRAATGGDAFAVRTNAAGIEGVVVARQLVPTAADGSVWPYLTPSNDARYVSAADVLTGRMPQGRLAGHLVFVGTSAIGLEDFRPTPLRLDGGCGDSRSDPRKHPCRNDAGAAEYHHRGGAGHHRASGW